MSSSWVIALALLLALLLAGATVTYSTGALAMLGYILVGEEAFLAALPRRIFSQLDVFALMAMPLFILLGELMNRGGITAALIDFAQALVGHLRGALGHVNVLTSVFFAGISGAAMADAAALGNTLVPAMRRKGYSLDYAAAITAASSIIGPIVPPSIIMVFYGAVMGVDVAALFAGGLVPGLLLAACLLIINGVAARLYGHPGGGMDGERPPLARSFILAAPALLLPMIIIVGVILGWMTPTEAAAVAVLLALLICAGFRRLGRAMLAASLKRTVIVSGAIFAMLAIAATVNFLGAITLFPEMVAEHIGAWGLEGIHYLILLFFVFLLFGMIAETQIALVLVAPLLVPIALAQGADPVHIGVVTCLNLSMGLVTPPLGGVLLVTASVTGINYWRLVVVTLPFVALQLGLLFLLYLVPEITLWLPRALGLA